MLGSWPFAITGRTRPSLIVCFAAVSWCYFCSGNRLLDLTLFKWSPSSPLGRDAGSHSWPQLAGGCPLDANNHFPINPQVDSFLPFRYMICDDPRSSQKLLILELKENC